MSIGLRISREPRERSRNSYAYYFIATAMLLQAIIVIEDTFAGCNSRRDTKKEREMMLGSQFPRAHAVRPRSRLKRFERGARTSLRTRRDRAERGETAAFVRSVGFDACAWPLARAPRIPINNETKELRERTAPSGSAIFTSDNEPPADIYIFNSINPQSPVGSLTATRFPFRSPYRSPLPRPSTTPPRTPFISLN